MKLYVKFNRYFFLFLLFHEIVPVSVLLYLIDRSSSALIDLFTRMFITILFYHLISISNFIKFYPNNMKPVKTLKVKHLKISLQRKEIE